MHAVLIKNLLRLYSAQLRNWRSIRKDRILVAVLGFLFLPVMIILRTKDMFQMWLYLPQGMDISFQFISTAMLGVMFLLLLTGLPAAMHHFFLAKDLQLLLAAPVKVRYIYEQKFIETTAGNMGMFLLLGFPLLLGFVLAKRFDPFLLVILIFFSILFVVLISGVSIFVSLVLARFFAIKKMRRIATFLMGAFIILTWAAFQLIRVSRLDPSSIDFDPSALESFSNAAWSAQGLLLPSDWMTGVLRAYYESALLPFLGYGLALGGSAFILFTVVSRLRCALDHDNVHLESYVRRGSTTAVVFKSPRMRLYAALFRKDARLWFRDTRLFQSSLVLAAMVIVSPFLTDVGAPDSAGTLQLFMPYIPLLILTIIFSSTTGRQSVPMERLAFQIVKLSPTSLRAYFFLKAVQSALPSMVAAIVAFFLSAHRFQTRPGVLFELIVATGLLTLGSAALGQTFGAVAGRFDWTDPRYMVDMSWSLLSTLANLLYAALGIGILAALVYIKQPALAFLLYFFYVAFVFKVSTQITANRLQNLDWLY